MGKTYLACALANRACRMGYSSFYTRAPRLFYDLTIAKVDGSYAKLMNTLAGSKLPIIDDLGLAPMTETEGRDLLQVIEDRHGLSSTIVASQLPVGSWHNTIADPTIADAILDRLVHNAHKINLKGESMRKKPLSLTNTNNSEKEINTSVATLRLPGSRRFTLEKMDGYL